MGRGGVVGKGEEGSNVKKRQDDDKRETS